MNKNRKPRSLGRLLIDLTPLLDVIFIVLIVVLAGQENYSVEADRKYAEAEDMTRTSEQKVADIEAENAAYSEHMKAFEEINQYFNVVTVYSGYDPGNRKYRTIYLLINTDTPVEIELNPSIEGDAWDKCRKLIEETIKKDESIPTILSISSDRDDKMLYRDEESIYDIFKDLKDKYQNLTIR